MSVVRNRISLYLRSHFGFQAVSLIKKYEEKHKQVAEIASKLTIEEARFRDVQVLGVLYFHVIMAWSCFQEGEAVSLQNVQQNWTPYI